MNHRIGSWIQTFSGLAFYPLDPRPEDIRIEDIAHALALQCRFTGHSRLFYSVAEHSVHVSYLCEPEDALWGLLHDASEAYLGDVSRPLKRQPAMREYRVAERDAQWAVSLRFGLDTEELEPASVTRADMLLAAIEGRDLLPPIQARHEAMYAERWRDWFAPIGSCGLVLSRPWSPEEAESRFLARFRKLVEEPKKDSRFP